MGTVAIILVLFLLLLAQVAVLLVLEFLGPPAAACGHGDLATCAAQLPARLLAQNGHHVMIHIWQIRWTRLAFARSGSHLIKRQVEREENTAAVCLQGQGYLLMERTGCGRAVMN
ncbi:hypothetical protein BS78_10G208700 [Paspalum vaginatum]|nr:hypothetical protein BS78_10G208700 [Paspalum vaginatum]